MTLSSPNPASTSKKPSVAEVMDELQSRFLVNLPASELASSERLFFQIEQCYWFYEDFYADQYAHVPHVKLNDFASRIFAHCPLLQPLAHRCDELFQDFKTYQRQVPVVGCILLNAKRTKLVLVRNWKGTSWTFPRGKVNEGESDVDCARREVLEECGYDVTNSLVPSEYLDFVASDQRMRMYVCVNVPETYAFAPQTRKEISTIEWFAFDALPKKTWSVMPFMSRLKRWVKTHKGIKTKSGSSSCSTSTTANGSAGRAASVPRNRPLTMTASVVTEHSKDRHTVGSKKKTCRQERSVSTPHNDRPAAGKPSSKEAIRGHFGTEWDTATSYDGVNCETFGTDKKGFSVDEMFRVNERLTGQTFKYDGNPHDFGKPILHMTAATPRRADSLFKPNDQRPVQILARSLSAPLKRVDEETCAAAPSPRQSVGATPFGSFQFDAVDIMAVVT
uniref:Nudix hydrolase domain-containing protein n=1 Tax=Peronospora matthiolae TaxID=2874970 RepID=A0AAV1T638_9STRA